MKLNSFHLIPIIIGVIERTIAEMSYAIIIHGISSGISLTTP